jgi:hypothetical protein
VRYTRGELNDAELKNLGVYNDRELTHMRDVQDLAVPTLLLDYIVGGIIGLTILILWRMGNLALARRSLFNGAKVTLVIFVGDSWMFAYTDSLIQFYPQPLWVDASLGIVIFTILEAVILAGITFPRVRRIEIQRA